LVGMGWESCNNGITTVMKWLRSSSGIKCLLLRGQGWWASS
jgi:hypothetical protein